MAMSPTSSPRLPSPPPIAEDQIGPKSPLAGLMDVQGKFEAPETFTQGASRRIRPGTKSADMPEGPPLVDLVDVSVMPDNTKCMSVKADRSKIDTAFQFTEHLKALYNSVIHPEGPETCVPIDRATAIRLAQPPDGVDKSLWLYELCRFLCEKINIVIVALFAETPPCSAQTCPEMRASEWQYLCAVHDPPKPCCAIDYCCHTLDWAANVLTSPKHFPSRLSLNAEPNQGHQPLRQLTNIFRRVYRIFAHAWFQHRDLFWKVENKTGLYVLFKTVCDMYGLIPEENYTVPTEAEGLETAAPEPQVESKTTVLQTNANEHIPEHGAGGENSAAGDLTTGHSTKRILRQSPGSDTKSIATVIEENEEEVKGEAAGEDSIEMETPVVPLPIDHSAFALAVAGHPSTPEEKESNEEISITTDVPQHIEADTAEPSESKDDSTEEQATSEPVSETAETSEVKEVEAVAEQVETVDTEPDAKDAEEATKNTGD